MIPDDGVRSLEARKYIIKYFIRDGAGLSAGVSVPDSCAISFVFIIINYDLVKFRLSFFVSFYLLIRYCRIVHA